MILHRAEVQRDHGNLLKAGSLERLAYQIDIVGGAAAAARLGHQQRDLVEIIAPRLERVDHLTGQKQSGITGVVVDVLESRLADIAVGIFEEIHLISFGTQDVRDKAEMDRQHRRNDDGVVLLHLFGEFHIS